jgi:glycosyltransferase involved in cell wall biosynthesis
VRDRPLVSVIIPAFNREETISYCLDSVLAQTYDKFEVIVIDDVSTDNTVSVVRDRSDPRVRCVVLDRHSGAQAARNRGILEAKCDWIAFHDSDDEWLPDKLERQISVLAERAYDPWTFVYGNAFRLNKTTGLRSLYILPVVEGSKQYATLLRAPAPLFPTMLASKRAIEKIGYLDEAVPSFQEWDTSIRLAKYCTILHLREPLMVYHVGNRGAISGSGTRHVEGWHYIISKYENDIKELCGEETWRRLNVQLLWRCLNFGLTEHYDRYLSEAGQLGKHRLQIPYLELCRKYGIRPDNIIYRIAWKFLRP